MTSSTCTTIPRRDTSRPYSEKDWVEMDSIPDGPMKGYVKSKILAEKAAWDFYNEHKNTGTCFELVTILPSFSCGPILSASSGPSVGMILQLLDPNVEKVDDFVIPVCDVRNVALAHIKAAKLDEAVGNRFMIVSSKKLWSLFEIAAVLKELGLKVAEVRQAEHQDGSIDDSNMRNILKIEPFDIKKSISDTIESLRKYDLIK